ncbi:phosphohistidine phosphatase, SixA [Limimonas halophila]|uniref:Phosphohistidine phosphatase, SixA n=1 Tax=Limimonas halophila TaxID=1082479 RepID=A0A1G7QTL2_9PROT|nr:phosphohistidine phosphatase SixA [Limimonas halophila]SDG01794.1 phosphohistidine phosphatase, SixA [Limimonas halophila]
MQLVLVQHGQAVPKDQDPSRPLTDTGRRDADALASFLGRAEAVPPTVWHSGKPRARQTAETLSVGNAAAARDGLGPSDDVEPVAAELAERQSDLMIVGHQPFLGRLASRLLTGDPAGMTVAFEPGSAVGLDRTDEGWALAWMVRPGLFTRG